MSFWWLVARSVHEILSSPSVLFRTRLPYYRPLITLSSIPICYRTLTCSTSFESQMRSLVFLLAGAFIVLCAKTAVKDAIYQIQGVEVDDGKLPYSFWAGFLDSSAKVETRERVNLINYITKESAEPLVNIRVGAFLKQGRYFFGAFWPGSVLCGTGMTEQFWFRRLGQKAQKCRTKKGYRAKFGFVPH